MSHPSAEITPLHILFAAQFCFPPSLRISPENTPLVSHWNRNHHFRLDFYGTWPKAVTQECFQEACYGDGFWSHIIQTRVELLCGRHITRGRWNIEGPSHAVAKQLLIRLFVVSMWKKYTSLCNVSAFIALTVYVSILFISLFSHLLFVLH